MTNLSNIQYWDIFAQDQIEKDKRDYFTGEPEGTFGIDIFIGEEEYLGEDTEQRPSCHLQNYCLSNTVQKK